MLRLGKMHIGSDGKSYSNIGQRNAGASPVFQPQVPAASFSSWVMVYTPQTVPAPEEVLYS